MADQQTVRALVAADDADEVRRELEALSGAGVTSVDSRRPAPASYRDEEPDRRLHQLWRASTGYLAVTAVLGAIVGVVVSFVVPGLRELQPFTTILFGAGFAWGGAAFGWGRGAQVAKREDALGEDVVSLDSDAVIDLRLLTVEVRRDREKVAEHLVSRGAKLLDSHDPVVGPDRGLARPGDGTGTVPEGQRPGRDGRGGRVTRGRGSGDR